MLNNTKVTHMNSNDKADWLVRNVSATTKRSVKQYAAAYDINTGEALDELIAAAFGLHEQQKQQDIDELKTGVQQ